MKDIINKIKLLIYPSSDTNPVNKFHKPFRNPVFVWWVILLFSCLLLPIVIGSILWIVRKSVVISEINNGSPTRLLDETKLRETASYYDAQEESFKNLSKQKPKFVDPSL